MAEAKVGGGEGCRSQGRCGGFRFGGFGGLFGIGGGFHRRRVAGNFEPGRGFDLGQRDGDPRNRSESADADHRDSGDGHGDGRVHVVPHVASKVSRLNGTAMSFVGVLVVVLAFVTPAKAAFEAGDLARQEIGNLVGVTSASASCSGGSAPSTAARSACESGGGTFTAARGATGIHEIVTNQQTLITAIVAMVMATAGFMLFRTWLRRSRG